MRRVITLLVVFAVVFTSCMPTFTVCAEEVVASEALPATVRLSTSRSGEIPHPYDINESRWMLDSGDRDFVKHTKEQREEKIADLRDMTIGELRDYVTSQTKSLLNRYTRPSYEKKAAIMGVLGMEENDEMLTKKAITIIHAAVMESENIPPADGWTIRNKSQSYIPALLVFAYDVTYYSPYWDELSEMYGHNSREVVEKLFLERFDSVYTENIDRMITNWGGRWSKHLAGIALILNDPDRMRQTIDVMGHALISDNFYGDGMWREGTFSYGQMLVGNMEEAIKVVKLYKDPDDYVDESGLKLEYTDFINHWPIRNLYRNNVHEKILYPNGAAVSVNDNHYSTGFTHESPILEENLNNYELNHYGLYSMKYGNTGEAQQVNLKFPPFAAGQPYSSGHSHGDFLGLTMWSGGMEILPDGGYVFTSTWNRYIHMNAFLHNCSWIYSPNVNYSAQVSKYVRNNLYAYDDGARNNKQVQLIEAESKHAEGDGVDMKRRAIMLVAVDDNHSYTVDVQRLKGGTVHENFLRQVEEEDVDFNTSLSLPEPKVGTLGNALAAMGKSGGIVMSATAFTSPQVLPTDDNFDFIWKGKDSGTSLHAFIKGNPDTTIGFSKFPTMRRVTSLETKDDFPGYHFYQRKDVSPEDITLYAGVYEGYRDGEEGNVKNVQWLPAPDGDKMTQLVRVELADAVDYVYISNDNTPREYNGITFSGDYAAIRMSKDEKSVIWKYLYGEGSIDVLDTTLTGKKSHLYQVISVTGRSDDPNTPNTLRLRGVLTEDMKGLWGHTIYGDGSGNGFKITDVNMSDITIHNAPGFSLEPTGAVMNSFPSFINSESETLYGAGSGGEDKTFHLQEERRRRIKGNVWFEVKVPTFEKN